MEDFYKNKIDGVVWEIVGIFGVFDGHGGGWAAEYVKHNLFSNQIKHSKFIFDKESVIADAYSQIDPEFLKAAKYFQKNLFSNLMNHPNFITDNKSSIEDAFNHTDIEFLKVESEGKNQDSGSAATTAILLGNHLIVANVGDSRAVICRDGNAIALSRDHKPDLIDEQKRVEDAGGFVVWCDAWRVCGVLALSRAFGNRFLKQFVVAGPEIQETIVDSSLEFLIIPSDGLWDVVTNEEAVALIRFVDDPKEAAKRLMVEAYRKGSSNNITCYVVRFLWDECGGSRSSSLLRFQCGGASNMAAFLHAIVMVLVVSALLLVAARRQHQECFFFFLPHRSEKKSVNWEL